VFLTHFRLNADPFAVALDPAYFYASPDHREALATLFYVVTQKRGCGMMLAETGVGKTLVLRYLRKLIGAGADMVFITGPLNAAELLDSIAAELGIAPTVTGAHRQLRAIEETLAIKSRKGRQAVLAVDDVDQLTPDAFELLQILCGFENAEGKTVELLLSGRPTLMRALAAPSLERLRQSIDASCRIAPLDSAATAEYLYHRLLCAGATHNVFTDEAAGLLAAVTRGIPRRINQLGHQTLARAWSRGSDRVDEDVVWEVIYELPVPDLLACGPPLVGKKELGRRHA
jgi:type II secretory pathway predicted ATPase ExeA